MKNINDDRVEVGKREFLVKWVGYLEEENSWEPEENLDGCQLILKTYLAKKNAVTGGPLQVDPSE